MRTTAASATLRGAAERSGWVIEPRRQARIAQEIHSLFQAES